MPALAVSPPFAIFPDINGNPLDNGAIYIGVAGLPAATNPISVFFDESLSVPAAQPVTVKGGYPMNGSTRARLFVNSDYSIEVRNVNGTTVFSALESTDILSSDLITFIQAGANAVQRTVQSKLRDTVSVKDFGAVGDGVTNDTAAIQSALASVGSGGAVYFPTGTYRVTALLTIPGGVIVYGDGMTATRVRQEGAAYCFALGSGAVMRDMRLDGSASATGGINIDNCGLGQVENVRIEGFNAAAAIGIRINGSYRIKLSYLYIYDCYNGLNFTGNVTTFEFDKGNIATTNASGKAINAPAGGGNTIEAYFNTVYFESCYGANPIFFQQSGRVVFTACGFEAMCTNPSFAGSIANPIIIRCEPPTLLSLQNCQFSGLLSQQQTYTGALTYIYMGNDASQCTISGCSFYQAETYVGLTLRLVRVVGKETFVDLNNNILFGPAFATMNAAEAVFMNGIENTYNPLFFSATNNKILVAGLEAKGFEKTSLFDSAPPLGSAITTGPITASGASTTVYTRTFPAGYLGKPKTALRITAWGKRTGTAGTKRALLQINTGGINNILLANAVTAASDWRGEAILFWRAYNVLSVNVQIQDAAASLTGTDTWTRDWAANAGTIEIILECAGGGDTMTLEGMTMERF